jgi:hypothetical protein
MVTLEVWDSVCNRKSNWRANVHTANPAARDRAAEFPSFLLRGFLLEARSPQTYYLS